MLVIDGFFSGQGHATGPGILPAPYVHAYFRTQQGDERVRFLIDTGADFTTLSPFATHRLLGNDYLNMDFSTLPGTLELQGIGGVHLGIRTPAELLWRARDGAVFATLMHIVLVQPTPPTPGLHGNWTLPSLLGRDALRYFDLQLSYNPPTVTLLEATPA